MTVAAVKALIVFYALAYGVSPALATEVCYLESSFDMAAVGDQGNAHGLYQFWPPLWQEQRARMGLSTEDLRLDPRENIRTAMFTMSQGLGRRWSTWERAQHNIRESVTRARLRRIKARYEGGI